LSRPLAIYDVLYVVSFGRFAEGAALILAVPFVVILTWSLITTCYWFDDVMSSGV
jgi:hypothetical protein